MLPWPPARADRVYALPNPTLEYLLDRRRSDLRRLLQEHPLPNATATSNVTGAWQHVFAQLSANGLRAGPIGIELAPHASLPTPDSVAGAALQAVLRLLVFSEGQDVSLMILRRLIVKTALHN